MKITKANYIYIKKEKALTMLMCAFLIYNPYFIYNVGFLLSFIISFFIIVFSKKGNYFKNLIRISFIAFFASLPIIIYNFFEINFLSPALNLIFIPIITIIIFPLSFAIILFPKISIVYTFFINILEKTSILFSNIDSLIINFKKPSIVLIIIYYVFLYIMLKSSSKKKILIFIIALIIYYNINYLNPYSTLTTLDVGNGDSILISLKHNQGNILVDTGNQNSDYNIIPYLKSLGIRKIDYLVLTHGDDDHLGEAINIIENIIVKKIFINNNALNNAEIKIIEKKDNYEIINQKEIYINNNYFHLKSYKELNENDSSIILYGDIEESKILLLGDISKHIEERYIKEYKVENIDLLKIAHHGSKTSTSKDLIKKTDPQTALISVGKRNSYSHPHEETINTLKNIQTFSTAQNGAIKYNLTTKTITTVIK